MARALTPDEIIAALRRHGIPFREVVGWRTRSNGGKWGDVTGFMWHHTGDDAPDTNSLSVVTHGHSTLSGPLCNFALDDHGVVHLVAAGPANHAGGGDPAVLAAVQRENYGSAPPPPRYVHGQDGAINGNPRFYGVEALYYRTLTPALRAAMPRLAAAVIDALDRVDAANEWTAKSAIGHLEWQRGKIDPRLDGGQTCATLRAETAARLNPTEEPDMDATQAKQLAETHAMLTRLSEQAPRRYMKPDPDDPKKRRWIQVAATDPEAQLVPLLDALGGNALQNNIHTARDELAQLVVIDVDALAAAIVAKLPTAAVSPKGLAAELIRQLAATP